MYMPPYQTPADAEDALRQALRGVELNAERERVIAWMSLQPPEVIATIVALIDHARQMAPSVTPVTTDTARSTRAVLDYAAGTGNSGAGFWP